MTSNNTDAASIDKKNESIVNNTRISNADSKKVPPSITK